MSIGRNIAGELVLVTILLLLIAAAMHWTGACRQSSPTIVRSDAAIQMLPQEVRDQ